MDKVKVAKAIGKIVVSCGTSFMLGGIGGLSVAGYTGIAKTIAKITVPAASAIWSTVLSKQSDPVVEETVDQVAGVVKTVSTIIGPVGKTETEEN